MRRSLSLVVARVAATSVPPALGAAPALGGEPSAAPLVTPDGVAETRPAISLLGAFGRVVGGTVDVPADAYPGVPLDTWIRRAPLGVFVEDDSSVVLVSVESAPLDADETFELSGGAVSFDGPDTIGESIVTATVRDDRGRLSQHAWLVDVPDREGGVEALYEIVPPEILLASGAAEVAGEPGNTCYVDLCSDVGFTGDRHELIQ